MKRYFLQKFVSSLESREAGRALAGFLARLGPRWGVTVACYALMLLLCLTGMVPADRHQRAK